MKKGFTIIELLLVLSILCILMAIIFPVIIRVVTEDPQAKDGREVSVVTEDNRVVVIRGTAMMVVDVEGGALVVRENGSLKKSFGSGSWKDFEKSQKAFHSITERDAWIAASN